MTVAELIKRLEEQDPNAEVQLMTQSNWPMRYAVKKLWIDEEPINDDDDIEIVEDCSNVVFIVEGEQLGYGNKNAW